MSNPLVSVLMTAYNRENFISEAIESVLASSYENFELIIVDDSSTDSTVEIAKTYEKKDDRIKVYLNERNLGDYPNRNKASTYASGEYIMFVDSDDKLLADGMARCVSVMERYGNASFGLVYRDEHVQEAFIIDSGQAIQRHFFERPFLFIGPGGTILRRAFLHSVNGYPERYGPANDMYFNLKAACATPVVLIPFDFVYYREHDGQEIKNTYSYLFNNYKYLDDAIAELPLPLTDKQKNWISKKNKRRFTVNILKYFFRTFNMRKTVHAIQSAGFTAKDAMTGIFHFD